MKQKISLPVSFIARLLPFQLLLTLI